MTAANRIHTAALALVLAAASAAGPAGAQLSNPPVIDQTPAPPERLPEAAPETIPDAAPDAARPGEGFSLIEEGARLFLRGIITEMEPHMDSLRDLTAELEPALRELAEGMGPALVEMMRRVDDITHYSAPEFLENGDIIIRRNPDAPPWQPRSGPGAAAPEAIDL